MFKNYCKIKSNNDFIFNWIEHFKLIGDIEMNWIWNAILNRIESNWIEQI